MCATSVTVSTEAIAIAAVVNLGISLLLWFATKSSADISKKILESSNRPYVGLEGVAFTVKRDKKSALVQASIKNFGIVAAENCDYHWDVFLGGHLQPYSEMGVQSGSMTLFPSLRGNLLGTLAGDAYAHVMSGQMVFEIVIYIKYEQGTRNFEYNEKHRYFPDMDAFINLGEVKKNESAKHEKK
jgi:hypothetical protein